MQTITSLLDTDFYKISMMQAVLHRYPGAWVKYAFKWRNWDKMLCNVDLESFVSNLNKCVDCLCELKFEKDELEYLSEIQTFKRDFVEQLVFFRLNRDHIYARAENGELKITVEGPWYNTILFEVPVLALVSELYTRLLLENGGDKFATMADEERESRLNEKIKLLRINALFGPVNLTFADFGTRRRASFGWHEKVVRVLDLKCPVDFIGTSNVLLAKKFGLKPIGTMAHEWIMAHQQLGGRPSDCQAAALQAWAEEYRGELGIALSDTLGFDAFLKDFDRYFASLYDGCRHDSGDPYEWCEKLIVHYESIRIDPRTKTAVFSDGLTFEKVLDLEEKFSDRINVSFGIGTDLTNDCGFTAPQIVMKMVECNGNPVAKISDSPGKGMCEDPCYEEFLKRTIERKVGK